MHESWQLRTLAAILRQASARQTQEQKGLGVLCCQDFTAHAQHVAKRVQHLHTAALPASPLLHLLRGHQRPANLSVGIGALVCMFIASDAEGF